MVCCIPTLCFCFLLQLYLGAGFNLVGSCLRWISTGHHIICSPHFSHSGFLVAMIGQILTACAQPFLLYAPTKLAALWFGPKERAFCTMLASLGNPIGLALAQLLSPNIVTETDRLPVLVIISIKNNPLTFSTFLSCRLKVLVIISIKVPLKHSRTFLSCCTFRFYLKAPCVTIALQMYANIIRHHT